MRCHSLPLVSALALGVAAMAVPVSAQTPVYGGATPQEVAEAVIGTGGEFSAVLPYVPPADRRVLAEQMVGGMLMLIRVYGSDPEMDKVFSPAERKTRRATHAKLLDAVKPAFSIAGVTGLVGKAPLAPETKQAMGAALARADTVVLLRALLAADKATSAILETPHEEPPPAPLPPALTGFRITGDTASARSGKDTVKFVRVGGRWYLDVNALQ